MFAGFQKKGGGVFGTCKLLPYIYVCMFFFVLFCLFVCLFVCFVFAGFSKKGGGVISYMYVIAIHVSEKMGTGGDFKFFSFSFFFICFVLFCFVLFISFIFLF